MKKWKRDPDCEAVAKKLGIPYSSARIFKALSFGVMCEVDLLMWLIRVGDDTAVSMGVVRIRRAAGVRVDCVRKGGGYIVRCPDDLAKMRAIIHECEGIVPQRISAIAA